METANLTYLLSHPWDVGVGVDHPIALVLLAAAAVIWRRHLAMPAARKLAALRTVAFVAAILSLAGVHLTASLPSNELTVIAAVDTSGSIGDRALAWSHRYVDNVRASLAPHDQLSVLRFDSQPSLVQTATSRDSLQPIERADPSSTNISAAIDQALSLYPANAQKALLLVTDGNETNGKCRDRIETMRSLGVRVYTATPPSNADIDTRITHLSAPEIAAEGRALPIRIVIRNEGSQRPAVLNLYLDGLISDSTAVDLQAGLNTLDLLLRPPAPGAHIVRAQVAADGDSVHENDSLETTVNIRPKTRVLLASRNRFSALADVLATRGFSVAKVSAAKLPTEAEGYASYQAVILEDPRGLDLIGTSEGLEQFVRVGGGGLIVAGGGKTFGDKRLKDTALAQMLPVTLEERRPRPGKREAIALFLVIDRSNSMGFNSRIGTLRDGEKLRYAVKAGIAVVKQLKDRDQVGVIAFDARPHEIAPLRPLRTNRNKLLEALPRIVESGGTDFYDALRTAADQLRRSRVSRKHVVLLTDGDTNRAGRGEYREMIREIADSNISVTTIRIGDNTVNLKLLQDISSGTGGSFHHVANAQMLPDLMLRDTSRALRPLAAPENQFLPAVATDHRLLNEVNEESIPHLTDYAFSKPKPSSETLLQVIRAERKDPILNVWRYGVGRVAAFTASPNTDAETWPGWNGFARFWSQLTYWTARRESDTDVSVRAVRRSDSTVLTVTTFARSKRASVTSGHIQVGEDLFPIAFDTDENGRHLAIAPSLPAGRYPVQLRTRDTDGNVREITTSMAVPQKSEEESLEYGSSGINRELLRELATKTGGIFDARALDITDRPTGFRSVPYPLTGFFIPLAMLTFFIDIAVRRFQSIRSAAGRA